MESAEVRKGVMDVRGGDATGALPTGPALPPPLPADGCFSLPLALRAWLLVEAALPQLGIESRPLNFAFEAAEGPLEALVLLNDDFQT